MKVSIKVVSYDESQDQFLISFYDANTGTQRHTVDAVILPLIVREFGSPDEFVGRTFNLDF